MQCTIYLNIRLNNADTTGWHSLAEDYRRQVNLWMPLELELDTEVSHFPSQGVILSFDQNIRHDATDFCNCPKVARAKGKSVVERVELSTGKWSHIYIYCEEEVVSDAQSFCDIVLQYVLCYGFELCIGSHEYEIPDVAKR